MSCQSGTVTVVAVSRLMVAPRPAGFVSRRRRYQNFDAVLGHLADQFDSDPTLLPQVAFSYSVKSMLTLPGLRGGIARYRLGSRP